MAPAYGRNACSRVDMSLLSWGPSTCTRGRHAQRHPTRPPPVQCVASAVAAAEACVSHAARCATRTHDRVAVITCIAAGARAPATSAAAGLTAAAGNALQGEQVERRCLGGVGVRCGSHPGACARSRGHSAHAGGRVAEGSHVRREDAVVRVVRSARGCDPGGVVEVATARAREPRFGGGSRYLTTVPPSPSTSRRGLVATMHGDQGTVCKCLGAPRGGTRTAGALQRVAAPSPATALAAVLAAQHLN